MWHEVAVVTPYPSDQVQNSIRIDDLDSSFAHSLQPVLNAPEVAGIHVIKPTESYEVRCGHAFKTPMRVIQFDNLGGIAFTPAATDENNEPLFEIVLSFEMLENLINRGLQHFGQGAFISINVLEATSGMHLHRW